jgi:hypothetical protein
MVGNFSGMQESQQRPGEVSLLLEDLKRGDRSAEGRLMTLVYDELRRLAANYMRKERPTSVLCPYSSHCYDEV